MSSQRQERRAIIEASLALHRRGWVANHDGNLTRRLAAGRYLATPTATSKADVSDAQLIEVDDSGNVVAGRARAFSELAIHLAIYAARDDIGAVIHAHCPYATALACSGNNLIERPFIAEAVVSLGSSIPPLGYTAPGTDTATAIAKAAADVDAVLCQNHGVFSWGRDLEQALLRMELVEHLARIATLAQATGGVRPLPADALPPLLASRAKAGLGKAADRAKNLAQGPVVACAPAPHSPVATRSPGSGDTESSELARLIREELLQVLREP